MKFLITAFSETKHPNHLPSYRSSQLQNTQGEAASPLAVQTVPCLQCSHSFLYVTEKKKKKNTEKTLKQNKSYSTFRDDHKSPHSQRGKRQTQSL